MQGYLVFLYPVKCIGNLIYDTLKGAVRFMFWMSGNMERVSSEMDLEANANGMICHTSAERQADRAMRIAVKAYHQQLGIYEPTIWERVSAFWKKGA